MTSKKHFQRWGVIGAATLVCLVGGAMLAEQPRRAGVASREVAASIDREGNLHLHLEITIPLTPFGEGMPASSRGEAYPLPPATGQSSLDTRISTAYVSQTHP